MITPIQTTESTVSSITVHPQSSTTGQANQRFIIPSLATLHNSTFARGFSNNECQAAARALLRHDVHIDGTHYQARHPGGLHPSYIGFTSTTKRTGGKSLTQGELLEASLQDVFDMLSMQDHLDGKISVLVQCAGSEAVTLPKSLPIDLYVIPRELQETPKQIGGDLAIWVQVFAQEFAMPHI
ncbi:hypothetical protein BDR03DRAFT_982066 [Suillus americanus]|nr:hypothetical protein BDR03DRAFT_982066 [Suillus americanus]